MKITISQEGTSPISIYVGDIKDAIEHKKYDKIFKQTKLEENFAKIYKSINKKYIFNKMYGVTTINKSYDDFNVTLKQNFVFKELVNLYKRKTSSVKIDFHIWCIAKPTDKYNKSFKLDIPSAISKYVTDLTCTDNSENSDYDCCSTVSINVNSNIF